MKTTKIFFLATTVLLLSVFATSCIPTVPGGNPTPTPQTDTSVVYNTFNDSIALAYYRVVNQSSEEHAVILDLDADGISDIDISWYIGVGFATCKIAPLNNCSLVTKNQQYSSVDFFNLNDIISSTNNIISSSFYTTGPENGVGATGGTFSYNNRYLGFTLNKTDGVHYGWMSVSYTATFPPPFAGFPSAPSYAKFKINSMAYKIAPNTPILAGKY